MSSASKIKVGIAGGAGYTGGELIRILINHPNVDITFIHSKSNAGNFIYNVHHDLLGDTQLKFSNELNSNIDVLFLCVGHGDAGKFLKENKIDKKIKIIDLSQDFRAKENSKNEDRTFTYGLPELNKEAIKKSDNIANPGCFATCIQLSLLPLAATNALKSEIHISATTGSTGAGQSLSETSHFSWRNNNQSVYKAFEHQHLKEIKQSLKQLQSSFTNDVNFIPSRGAFTRGIIASVYTECSLELDEVKKMYVTYYSSHPFVYVSETNINLKQVVNTNKCFLYIEKHGSKLMITSIIDNLLKGASGQAVQNMNLIFGLEETTGLKLKGSAF